MSERLSGSQAALPLGLGAGAGVAAGAGAPAGAGAGVEAGAAVPPAAGLGLASAPFLALLAPSPALSAAGLAAGLRKSVTYQPEPLSWNPAAVTCFSKRGAPQAGQSASGGSDILRSTSFV